MSVIRSIASVCLFTAAVAALSAVGSTMTAATWATDASFEGSSDLPFRIPRHETPMTSASIPTKTNDAGCGSALMNLASSSTLALPDITPGIVGINDLNDDEGRVNGEPIADDSGEHVAITNPEKH